MLKKQALQELYYDSKLSMWDMARNLSVTPATVAYWMKKHDLRRRSSSECAYVKQNPNGDPFKIKNRLTKKNKELLLCGLMLYWAEGSRRNKHVIQIANLDPRLLFLFKKFLKTTCGVKENKICLTVQLYRSFDKEETKAYWAKTLGIPKQFISVNIHSDKRSAPTRQWSKYGIARIEVRNVKLKQWIDASLERYLGRWI
jgi:hypothetical protein